MSEELRYYPLSELKQLSIPELRALWDLVPTDRQRAYRAVYERELHTANAEGSDERERLVARALVKRYADTGLVPLGMRWVRTPVRLQQAARTGALLLDKPAPPPPTKASPKVLVPLGVAAALMLGLILLRGANRDQPEPVLQPSAQVTATPLALAGQDAVIEGGDGARTALYPVSLQVTPPDADSARVWVVQRRAIRASEWHYDPNPDTASFVSGLAVHPVIGIPWSAENAAYFEAVTEGTQFSLQMNTGAVLYFQFAGQETVRRSATEPFRQITPGLVLALLGETDATGLPTAARTLIMAHYDPAQELSRGQLAAPFAVPTLQPPPTFPTIPTPTPIPFAGLDAQVIRVTYGHGQITAAARLYNDSDSVMTFAPGDFTLTLGYRDRPVGARLSTALEPFSLLPQQTANLSLIWAWHDEPFAILNLASFQFGLHLDP